MLETLGFHWPSLIVYLINFTLLLLLLYVFAYKPVLRMLDQRSERIKASLDAADNAREEASKSQQDTQNQIKEARLEGQRLIEQAKKLSEKYRLEEESRAKEDANKLIARAREDIEREKVAAIREVKDQFSDLAILAAEQIIKRTLDQKTHSELIAQVLKDGEKLGDSK